MGSNLLSTLLLVRLAELKAMETGQRKWKPSGWLRMRLKVSARKYLIAPMVAIITVLQTLASLDKSLFRPK